MSGDHVSWSRSASASVARQAHHEEGRCDAGRTRLSGSRSVIEPLRASHPVHSGTMSDEERRADRLAAIIGGVAAFVAIIVVIVWALATQSSAIAT